MKKALKKIYDKHNILLTNLKINLNNERDKLSDADIRSYDEQIVLLAGVLSDINKLIIGE